MRVARIFTGESVSPSLPLRQRASRYTFRAGRNLPDKEFRYLRTVIVTAAVHQSFRRPLSQASLTFWHWAGIGSHMLSYDFAETCVFGKQSLAPIPAAVRRLFSQSYETILPSSLGGITSISSVAPYLLPMLAYPRVRCTGLFEAILPLAVRWTRKS